MRADAIPVSPLASHALLGPGMLARLFGEGYALRGAEHVHLYRLGEPVARVAVRAAAAAEPPALALTATDFDAAGVAPGTAGLRLRGPLGSAEAPPPAPVRARLVLPKALRLAWRLHGADASATVALGPLALAVPLGTGRPAALAVDRALWLAAGCPETARWLPGIVLTDTAPEPAAAEGARVVTIGRRVVTETDVRQARLRRRRIRLEPGQVVTPAAQSLAREWDVFVSDEPAP
ncbi:MAG: hypothetical protein ACK41D_04505 [Rubricoccaceae bacterium]